MSGSTSALTTCNICGAQWQGMHMCGNGPNGRLVIQGREPDAPGRIFPGENTGLLEGRILVQEKRIQELEAQAAAMREALERACEEYEYAAKYKGEYLAEKHGDAETLAELRAALSTDAGKAMLDEMRRQSELYDKLIADRDAERRQLTERAEAAERELAKSEEFDKRTTEHPPR